MSEYNPSPSTDQSVSSVDKAVTDTADGERSVSDGRYLYCLVDLTTAESERLPVMGIGDTAVYVIEAEDVGAVVHECETVYDSDDPEQVKQWILTHQQVVDAAGEMFGTPLPMRFDTILEGGDTSVKRWLRTHSDTIHGGLTRFAGTWEYRIHLLWDSSLFEEQVTVDDDQLQEIQQRQQQSGAGKRFLLAKQREKRLRELKQQRREELADSLREAVSPVVKELTEQESHSPLADASSSSEREQVARLAVRAHEDDETTLGTKLDEIVEQEEIEIRFTGPWPPYTFAPDIE